VPKPADAAGIVSWVHFGDLHMTTRQEQNYRDFLSLVEEVNRVMADSLNFAYLPGDNADHGKAEEYALVREGLNRLQLPWFAIVGDHDVHSKRHYNFLHSMMPEPFYRFEVGSYRFIALDAFVSDDPKVFDVSSEQLNWLQQELELASAIHKRSVLFLHCYPSELGTSSSSLRDLIKRYGVLLVDMGHTHYNEIANNGVTLYTATRSTGQIEEGPVGFSVTNLDNGVVSWRFKPLGEWPLVMITAPTDERLSADREPPLHLAGARMTVRVKAWSDKKLLRGFAAVGDQQVNLEQLTNSPMWQADVDAKRLSGRVYPLTVNLTDEAGKSGEDVIRVVVNSMGQYKTEVRSISDKDNAVGAWPQRGILGTQLGPNKNGRKW
jgi:3',5'-cyclic-AMP phosphodiesterase